MFNPLNPSSKIFFFYQFPFHVRNKLNSLTSLPLAVPVNPQALPVVAIFVYIRSKRNQFPAKSYRLFNPLPEIGDAMILGISEKEKETKLVLL